ncbi:transforming growth factor beta activator LRRC32-like isoform X2 [Thalassophryne amazonica]|uniref:transforming growth factor beta activator LRRC32-like isoform X2 n=1 Tax=Thalassophryne amazonica TaxID=390379 RepID=UPI0014719E60|nr:transforming growth factor beta activator LRRC32-like isoform X2 [Thalassophryne amazonica]
MAIRGCVCVSTLCNGSSRRKMVRRMFYKLLILWSLSHDLYITGLHHHDLKSWHNHSLYSIPVDLDIRLRRLDLSNNFIRQLHTLGLPYLEQLDLSCNHLDLISEKALENLVQLEELNLSRNALNNNLGSNSKALQSISRLKTLDISMNSLNDDAAELYLQNKSSLDQLKMTGNTLKRLTPRLFQESRSLRAITLDENMIRVIEEGTFELLSRLEMLNLAKNNLAHICDFRLYQVKYLNLSRNSVEFFVTHQDDNSYRLEILDLSFNKLLYFPVVPKQNRLRYLYLQNNMVGTLSSEATMVAQVNSLYNEITSVATGENKIHSNWKLMPVVYIDLSYNQFTTFPMETLSFLSSLETLNIGYNCIQNIFWNMTYDTQFGYSQPFLISLKHLDLQSNRLGYISPIFLKRLVQLETLNLQGNSVKPCAPMDHLQTSQATMHTENPNMSCVDFGVATTLKHLSLQENNINTLKPNIFKKTELVSLNLARNIDMVMHEGALEGAQRSLQSLIISENNMSSSDLCLPCMPALTHLNMSTNHLDIIPTNLSCSPLREIDIRNNAFVSLNHSLIRALARHLNMMYISGNYFNCCDSKWLVIINELKTKLPDIGQAECFIDNHHVVMTEFLKSPSLYCLCHTNVQDINFGQMIIIVLSVLVTATTVIFTRNVYCKQTSFLV